MISINDKKEIIQKIANSKGFLKSETSKKLLDYILEASLKGESIKAISIANDIFQRDGNIVDGDDTIVRVYIHKLRGKIKEFYNNEGKEEKIYVEIPKGKYIFDFNYKSKVGEGPKRKTAILTGRILLILSFVLLLNAGAWVIFKLKLPGKTVNDIWLNYYKENSDIYIVFGEPFFYAILNKNTQETYIIRDFFINSENELKRFDHKFDSKTYEYIQNDLNYYSNNNIHPLPFLFNVLSGTKNKMFMKVDREMGFDEIKHNNIIYISCIKRTGFFNHFLEQSSFEIIHDYNDISLLLKTGTDTISYIATKSPSEYYNDYAYMVKIPSPNQSKIILIGDFHGIGNKGLMEFTTKEEAVSIILKQYPELNNEFPEYFEMLVAVSGIVNDNLTTEILYFNPIIAE